MSMQSLVNKGMKVILVGSLLGMDPLAYVPKVNAETSGEIVEVKSETNLLSTLTLGGAVLDQEFAADIKEYSASVGSGVTDIQLLAASDNKDAVISVNGKKISGGLKYTYTLATGENDFLITVEDGTNAAVTYTLTVTKAQSNNTDLKDITLSKGTLSFDVAVSEYSVKVENNVSALTVSPKAADTTASIKVNDQVFKSSAISVKIPVGKTKINVVVTAEDGTQKTYIVSVTRKAKTVDTDTKAGTDTGTKKDNPTKKGPSSSTGTKTKTQTPAGTTQQQTGTKFVAANPMSSASESTTKPGSEQVESSDNNGPKLSVLSLSNGTWKKTFASDEFTYHIDIDTDVESVKVSTTAAESGSTIKVEGKSDKTVSLKDSAKTIISVIVSNDDERSTYVLVFEKDIEEAAEADETETDETAVKNSTDEAEAATVSVASENGVQNKQFMRNNNNETNRSTSESSSIWSQVKNFFASIFE